MRVGGSLRGILSGQKMGSGELWGGCAACFVLYHKGEKFGGRDFLREWGPRSRVRVKS